MPSVNIIEGLPEFEAKLNKLALSVQGKLLLRAAKFGAEPIREEAAREAPRRTQRLSKGQIISMAQGESNAFRAVARIGPSRKVFWGLFQEEGTAFHPPQAFLGPSFAAKHKEALVIVRVIFIDTVNKAAR